MRLRLITDTKQDRTEIELALQELDIPAIHECSVHEQAEADDLAAVRFSRLPNLARFRLGHPCWRKITDPLLFASPGEEVVILGPDLFFPNEFRFESTPATGILLMWQPPSCLMPEETVLAAYRARVKLAHHVDIGVAHVREGIDLEWMDFLIEKLGGESIPRVMHVEAIVWAAIAMRVGGGYLNARRWHCWRNSQWKRVALRLGVKGTTLLRAENFAAMKCFHGGGAAKWWVPRFVESGSVPSAREIHEQDVPQRFVELSAEAYGAAQRLRRLARRLGYYRLMKA